MAKVRAVRREELWQTYTADSLYYICHNYVTGMKKYSDIVYPEKVDNRNPEEIARDRLKKMGLMVVK